MGYEIESPYIDIYYDSFLTENISVSDPRNKVAFKIYTTFNQSHDKSARIKILSGHGSTVKSDVYIILNNIEFDEDGLLLPSSYNDGDLTSRQLGKMVPVKSQRVLSDLLRECNKDFMDFFNKRISEAELKTILKANFKQYKF